MKKMKKLTLFIALTLSLLLTACATAPGATTTASITGSAAPATLSNAKPSVQSVLAHLKDVQAELAPLLPVAAAGVDMGLTASGVGLPAVAVNDAIVAAIEAATKAAAAVPAASTNAAPPAASSAAPTSTATQ